MCIFTPCGPSVQTAGRQPCAPLLAVMNSGCRPPDRRKSRGGEHRAPDRAAEAVQGQHQDGQRRHVHELEGLERRGAKAIQDLEGDGGQRGIVEEVDRVVPTALAAHEAGETVEMLSCQPGK